MSLVGIMHLLGHRSPKMTLHYAAVTQETIRDEYFAAIDKLENKYELRKKTGLIPEQSEKPTTAINSILSWLKKNAKTPTGRNDRQLNLLLKRLHRIKSEIAGIESASH